MPVLPTPRRDAVAVPGQVEPLSTREQEVLALLAAGHLNRAIAEELVITLDTVKPHVSRVFGSWVSPAARKPSPEHGSSGCCPEGAACRGVGERSGMPPRGALRWDAAMLPRPYRAGPERCDVVTTTRQTEHESPRVDMGIGR
jgi:DNA-binding CsgD family transcriptional regulator